jgi:hypothetical protein
LFAYKVLLPRLHKFRKMYPDTGYWLVMPPGLETRREIVAFRKWLLEEISQLSWHGRSAKAAAARSAGPQH